MRIDGLPNLQKVSQPNQRTESSRPRGGTERADDSVEISTSAKSAAELTAALKAAPEAANPRLAEIRERVQSGYYDSEDVRQKIAGAMLEADGIRSTVDEVAEVRGAQQQMADVPDVRDDRVAESRSRVATGYYDQADVRQETAQSIIDESV